MNNTNAQTENEALIRAILDERIKAIYDRNLEVILAMYTKGVVTFDLKDPLQNMGVDAVKKRIEEWFSTYKSPISQEIQKVAISCADDVAFSHCLTRTYGTATNDEKQDMWYRTTTGFKKINDKWLITHEHVSDPIDMKTGKVMFNLKP